MNSKREILASAFAASMALALAACGGGGGGNALPSSPATANTSSLKTAMAKITFTFSKSGATASAKATTASSRSPQYLPSTIQSVSVGVMLVNGSASSPSIAPTVAAVGPTAPGCGTDPNNSGNYLCTLTFALPIGADTLSVQAYDGTSGSGNLVSQQQTVLTVVAGQANTLAVTLDAVPGTIAVGTAPTGVTCSGSPLACSTTSGSGPYTIPLTVADTHGTPLANNTIAGSPTISASSDTTANLTVTVTQNPYAIVVTPVANGSANVTITATSASAGDGISSTTQSIIAFTVNAPPPTLNEPLGMTFDTSGNLWVANYGGNAITEYVSPYTRSPIFSVSNSLSGPAGVIFDSNNDLIVSNYNNNTISVFAPPYTGTPVTFAAGTAYGEPFQMAIDGSGKLYVTTSDYAISVFTPPFTSSSTPSYSITNGVQIGYGIAFDGSGNLWYMDESLGIEEYTPPFSASSAPALVMNNASLRGFGNLAFDASGNLYYTNEYPTAVGIVAPPFTSGSTGTTFGSWSTPYGIAVHGSDVFGANFGSNTISEFALPVNGSSSPVATVMGLQRSSGSQSLALPRGAAR